MREGLRIYNLFPTLAGTIGQWAEHLPRIAAMGFNAVYVNPFHYPGFSGSLYAVKDYYRLNPRFPGGEPPTATPAARFHQGRRACRPAVIMDLVVNHTSKDSELVAHHPDWFARDESGEVRSPFATDPADPTARQCGAISPNSTTADRNSDPIVAYFKEVVRHYRELGFAGFRCDAAYKVPAEAWRALIDAAQVAAPEAVFCAETRRAKGGGVGTGRCRLRLSVQQRQMVGFRESVAARAIRSVSPYRTLDRFSRKPRHPAAGERAAARPERPKPKSRRAIAKPMPLPRRIRPA